MEEVEEYLKWSDVIYIDSEKRLIYTGHGCSRIPALFVEMFSRSLLKMDLTDNKIHSLEGLSKFQALEELILDSNNLDDNFVLPHLPNLRTLSLNKNRLRNLESTVTKLSKSAPSLHYLSLLGNLICPDQLSDPTTDVQDYFRYRCYIVHHLPKLLFLDWRAVSLNEAKEAKLRGQFMRVRRPEPNHEITNKNDFSDVLHYSPLPKTVHRKKGCTYRKYSQKYIGRNSEGNKYIKNSDL
ncbi:leucine-rich melanocyte differentiation-associated protein-like [Ctenocephalides felis]|uniref:leucine-rich melanocyte differentiation-associated protein-like n=1 Tax=Ctenocephalides felis TaxID=7515 RepID=UPI000E6E246C|nr:leucine-rich melanocyte differentiation-associated protein-like [Ctenocephalides felis]